MLLRDYEKRERNPPVIVLATSIHEQLEWEQMNGLRPDSLPRDFEEGFRWLCERTIPDTGISKDFGEMAESIE